MCAVYEKRPLTQSRRPGPFSVTRSTRQCIALVHQHMNDRSKSSKTASRMVDSKHPLRALMKADIGGKGYLTHAELKECLERNFVVVLDSDEIERVIGQYASAIPTADGQTGFNYMNFVKSMNNMSQVCACSDAHPCVARASGRVRSAAPHTRKLPLMNDICPIPCTCARETTYTLLSRITPWVVMPAAAGGTRAPPPCSTNEYDK
jgi:hypothetical protein